MLSVAERQRVMRYFNDRFAWAVPVLPATEQALNSNAKIARKQMDGDGKMLVNRLHSTNTEKLVSEDDLIGAIISENHNLFKRLAQ